MIEVVSLPYRSREGWREASGWACASTLPPPLGCAESPLPQAGGEK
jgi:hypothetical protein